MISVEIVVVGERPVMTIRQSPCAVSSSGKRCSRPTSIGLSLPGQAAPICRTHLAQGRNTGPLAFVTGGAR